MARIKALMIAGPASGVGKTTVALALMAALRRRGLSVQPFKVGPDFIDAGHHSRVCGRAARNLDEWMLTGAANRAIFGAHASGVDVAIVEGVMGLFDGARGSGQGSTAAMAKLLGLPVVLVVDASKMAASVAALVRGFQDFDPELRISGVFLNRIGGPGHFALLRDALAATGCPPAVGYFPNEPVIEIPERHLGLYTAEEDTLSSARLERLTELALQNIDWDRLLKDTEIQLEGPTSVPARRRSAASVRIAVARDQAFCFYYEDNLDGLRAAGAELVAFSPLRDERLPSAVDAIYIGGGYPELHARALAANDPMRAAIHEAADCGVPIYAECGGLMYLGRELRLRDGAAWPMAGVLPFATIMTERLVRFGYAEVRISRDCLLGRSGTIARGHSFHYSTICDNASPIDLAYQVRTGYSGIEGAEGYCWKNVLASYIHLHFVSNSELATNFVRSVRNLSRLDPSPRLTVAEGGPNRR